MPLYYHRINSQQWINGSIREDLLPDERSVWADLIALAAMTREERRGYIERSEGIPFRKSVLLAMLNVSEELFDRAVDKCKAEGRLQVFEDGTMYLTNWEYYNGLETFKEKKLKMEMKQSYARESRKRRETVNESIARSLLILNKRLRRQRYEFVNNADILDKETGELVSYEKVKETMQGMGINVDEVLENEQSE